MRQRILNEINDYVNTLYTCFKISAGDFVKNNFPSVVENFWDDKKTDEENLECVKDVFQNNVTINETLGNPELAKVIQIFCDNWLNKIQL